MNKFLFILCSIVFTSHFEINPNYGRIIIDDVIYEKPFLGGFNKPKIQWIDWDLDNDLDLFLLDEDGMIRYYDNIGNNDFSLITTNFMNIYGVAWFYIGQFDDDDEYEFVTQDKNNINQLMYYDIINDVLVEVGAIYSDNYEPVISDPVMTPTFVDIDNDGDLDFFTGNMVGTLSYYENQGTYINDIPILNLVTNFWQDIYIVGGSVNRHGASALSFIDIDNDGDYDLSWGDYFQQSLYIIINEGNANVPYMDNVNFLNQYPIEDPIITAGQNMPTFADIDNDGDIDLFVTVLSGAFGYQLINNFYFYERENESYELITSNLIPTLDLTSDVYPDLVDIDNDGDLDLFIGTDFDITTFPWTGKIYYFENTSVTDDDEWTLIDSDFIEYDLGNNLAIDFVDIDNDNDNDIFVGDFNGYVQVIKNIGTAELSEFIYHEQIDDIDLSGYSVPKLVDIDLDNDYDLFIGDSMGRISYYENQGSNIEYDFVFVTNNYQNISVGGRAAPDFIDLDNDNDFDLVIGSQYNGIQYYENVGDAYNPEYIENNNFTFSNVGLNTFPSFSYDTHSLLVGISTGGIYSMTLNSCIPGDVNNDLIVNVIDIIQVINFILLDYQENSDFLCLADMNYDSIINIIDVVEIVNIIIGM